MGDNECIKALSLHGQLSIAYLSRKVSFSKSEVIEDNNQSVMNLRLQKWKW